MYIKINLNMLPLWVFLVLIIVDIVMIPARSKVKISVNKKNNSSRVFENNSEYYMLNYPLREIKALKDY